MTRPTKLTPERHKQLIEGIRLGLRIEVACDVVEINRTTLLNWQNRGRTAVTEFEEHLADMDPDERTSIEDRIEDDPTAITELVPEADQRYVSFFVDVTRARAEWERSAQIRIEAAVRPQEHVTEKFDGAGVLVERTVRTVPGDWKAEAFILERRVRQAWGKVTTVEGGDKPIEVDVVALRERGREIVARIAERATYDADHGESVLELSAGDAEENGDTDGE